MKNKQKLFSLISYLVIGAIFSWLLVVLLKNWQGIVDYHFQLNGWYLFLAFVFSIGAVLIGCFIWQWLFSKLSHGQKTSFWLVFKVRNYALLGKYLPGRVFVAVGQAYFGKKEGMSAKSAGLTALFELALSLLAHFLLSLLLLWLFFSQSGFFNLKTIALAIFLLILGIIFLHPKIIGWLINNFLAKIKKTAVPKEAFLSYRTMLIAAFCYLPLIFSNGLAFAFLAKAILAGNSPNLLFLAAAFVVSGFLGNFIIIAPGGLGVREGALTFLLKESVGSGLAVVVSLFSRIWFILIDLFLLVFTFLAIKITEVRPPLVCRRSDLGDLDLHNTKLAQNYRQIRQQDHFAVFYQDWILEKITALLGKEAKQVLDYCCGSGILYPFVSQESQYVGVDFSSEMLKIAKEKFAKESNFQVFQQDGQHLEFSEGSFDGVIAKGALHHLTNAQAGLLEIARVLRPNGLLVLAEPATSPFLKRIRQLVYSHNSHFAKSHRAFSKKELFSLLKQANFQLISVNRYGFFSHILAYPDIFKPANYLPYGFKKWLFHFDNFLLKLPLIKNLSLGLMIKAKKI